MTSTVALLPDRTAQAELLPLLVQGDSPPAAQAPVGLPIRRPPMQVRDEKRAKAAEIEALSLRLPPAWQDWGTHQTCNYKAVIERARAVVQRKRKSLDELVHQLKCIQMYWPTEES